MSLSDVLVHHSDYGRRVLALDLHATPLGLSEGWAAPFVMISAPEGFGEAHWMPSGVPETTLAFRLGGAPIRCDFGKHRGVTSWTKMAVTLQPRGTPNAFSAEQAIRFGQIFLPDHLIDQMAEELRPASTAGGYLRDDLVFIDDAELDRRCEAYAQAAMSNATRLEMWARSALLVERLLTAHHGFAAISHRKGRASALSPRTVRDITDYILVRLAEAVTIDDLAAMAHLSPYHFARAFKAATGRSPHRYQMLQRLEAAKAVLAETSAPVTDVAAKVGYDDPAYFARLFRREVGVTPSAFRRTRRF